MTRTTNSVTVGVDRAIEIIKETTQSIGSEQTGIINAYGRVLAENIASDTGLPSADVAAIDGYAVSSKETAGASARTPVTSSILAESVSSRKYLEQGTVLPIHKGEFMPEGADAVIEHSKTYRPLHDPEILLMEELKAHKNVQQAGSLLPSGEVILEKGTKITGREMSILAALGRAGIKINRKPQVGIITTGVSVVDLVEELEPGKVRNLSRYSLIGMVLASGCEIGRLSHIKEGRIALQEAIKDSRDKCSAIIIALGPGEKHDSAISALRNTGEVIFERVNMQPAMTSAFGITADKPIFIVPADSVKEAFEIIIKPCLNKMLGLKTQANIVTATLQSCLKLNPANRHYIKAITEWVGDSFTCKPVSSQATDYKSTAACNSLVIIPENIDTLKRGEKCEVLLLE